MDRIKARMLETEKVTNIINNLIDRVKLFPNGQRTCLIIDNTQGAGLVDTTRGALGHWVSVNNRVISHYNINYNFCLESLTEG